MLPPFVMGLLMQILGGAGLRDFLASLGNEQLKKLTLDRFTLVSPAVVADLEADGLTYASTKPDRPNPPEYYVSGIIYRLLKAAGVPGGDVRDVIRDKKVAAVVREVGEGLTPEMTHAAAVEKVVAALTESLF